MRCEVHFRKSARLNLSKPCWGPHGGKLNGFRGLNSGVRMAEDNRTGIDVYLCRARRAVEQLGRSQERALRVRQFQEEAQWLTENKNRFAGQWIAIQDRQLLAVGATAREVFPDRGT